VSLRRPAALRVCVLPARPDGGDRRKAGRRTTNRMPNRSRFARGELNIARIMQRCPGALVPKGRAPGFFRVSRRLSFTHGTVGSAKYSGRDSWATPARDPDCNRNHCGTLGGCGDRAALRKRRSRTVFSTTSRTRFIKSSPFIRRETHPRARAAFLQLWRIFRAFKLERRHNSPVVDYQGHTKRGAPCLGTHSHRFGPTAGRERRADPTTITFENLARDPIITTQDCA
jgi:hypothetical protein